jgi:CDP-4-dehydro-6-deoxyglucose reductase
MLFWGVRAAVDLYDDAWLRDLALRHARFRYMPVLSEQAAGSVQESGFVHEAVLRRIPGLAGYDIYAAGPPAMIDAVRASLPRQGADPARIYFDSFDYAPA